MNTVRAAAFLQFITAFSAAWTLLLVLPVLYWQVTSWIRNGEWSPFPISKVLALAGFDQQPAIDVTGSLPATLDISLPSDQGIFAWFLDFPTIGLLVIVAAILLTFSISAASIQKQLTAMEE